MSKLVNSIAEDGLQLTLDLSPRKDGLDSPRYRSPMKEVLEVTHSPVKNSFPSPEEAVKTPVSWSRNELLLIISADSKADQPAHPCSLISLPWLH